MVRELLMYKSVRGGKCDKMRSVRKVGRSYVAGMQLGIGIKFKNLVYYSHSVSAPGKC